MALARENPLAYNGWAKAMTTADAEKKEQEWMYREMPPKNQSLNNWVKRTTVIPDGPPPGDPAYEFECPAQAWIALVEACRLEHVSERRDMVLSVMELAKNSHWTEELYQEELHLLDVEYGGDTQELSSPEVSQAPSNPCATCGVDTGSDRMFCAKHDE